MAGNGLVAMPTAFGSPRISAAWPPRLFPISVSPNTQSVSGSSRSIWRVIWCSRRIGMRALPVFPFCHASGPRLARHRAESPREAEPCRSRTAKPVRGLAFLTDSARLLSVVSPEARGPATGSLPVEAMLDPRLRFIKVGEGGLALVIDPAEARLEKPPSLIHPVILGEADQHSDQEAVGEGRAGSPRRGCPLRSGQAKIGGSCCQSVHVEVQGIKLADLGEFRPVQDIEPAIPKHDQIFLAQLA